MLLRDIVLYVEHPFLIDVKVSPECENQSNTAPIIAGVIIAISGVAVGVSGLIAALVMYRKMRSSHCITLTTILSMHIMCRAVLLTPFSLCAELCLVVRERER